MVIPTTPYPISVMARQRLELWPYGAAALVSVVSLGVRAATQVWFGGHLGLMLVIPGLLVIAAAFGQIGPTLVAAAIGFVGCVLIADKTSDLFAANATLVLSYWLLAPGIAYVGRRLRNATEMALLEARERTAHLQSILDCVPDAMIVIDPSGQIQSFSSAAERLFGWTAVEAVGANVRELMPEPYRTGHSRYLERYLTTGKRRVIGVPRLAMMGARKDGSIFPMELSIGEMVSGTHQYFTGFVHDLTESQAAERRLQEMQAELIHMSRLTSMGEMASALAHELNQPLSAIASYMQGSTRLLARSDPDLELVRKALGDAGDQSLRAGAIIRRLRDFVSRGEADMVIVNLPRLIEEAGALAMLGARESGVRVRYDISGETPLVVADRVQIQQVIMNLMRNAIEAMAESDHREMVVATHLARNNLVQISVSDSGPGISEEVAERLFQPFVTTKASGMGVGLSISRTIIEAHGGQIWVEPAAKGGAVFRLTLRAPAPETAGL